MAITIWHNPRCSKSREALAILEEQGFTANVRLYLQDTPTADEIADVLRKINLPAIAIVRTKEKAFKQAGLDQNSSDEVLISAMAADPKLIERAIVINGERAILGRPPEAILDIL